MSDLKSNVFYVSAKCIFHSCPECGNPVPLGGPVRKSQCPECQSPVEISESFWQAGLRTLQNVDWILAPRKEGEIRKARDTKEIKIGNAALKLEFRMSGVRCVHCKAALPPFDENSFPEQGMTVDCPSCGAANRFEKAPDWLGESNETITNVSALESEGHETEEPAQAPIDKPVIMQCPNCSANLKITAGHKRIHNCEFCAASVRLPDDVWRQLHPVKKAADWIARLKIKSRKFRKAAWGTLGMLFFAFLWLGGSVGFVGGMVAFIRGGSIVGGIAFGLVGIIVFGIPGLVMMTMLVRSAIRYFGYASQFRE